MHPVCMWEKLHGATAEPNKQGGMLQNGEASKSLRSFSSWAEKHRFHYPNDNLINSRSRALLRIIKASAANFRSLDLFILDFPVASSHPAFELDDVKHFPRTKFARHRTWLSVYASKVGRERRKVCFFEEILNCEFLMLTLALNFLATWKFPVGSLRAAEFRL